MSDKMMTPKLRTGDTFKDVTDETIYIIADIGRIFTANHYALVSMIDGRLYDNPVPNIENVFSDDEGDFVPVKIDVKSGLQSRKREVEWGKWRITQDKVNKGDVPFQSVELPDGGTCFRIGKYTDAPVKPEPELSRFLPEGCVWKCVDNGVIYTIVEGRVLINSTYAEYWHARGLLHPSEGGGFQKHKPGDPMPCDGELEIDALLECPEIETCTAKNFYWTPQGLGTSIIGWRPHYKEQI